jgi:DNA-binding beta-propeller fold protein YncE
LYGVALTPNRGNLYSENLSLSESAPLENQENCGTYEACGRGFGEGRLYDWGVAAERGLVAALVLFSTAASAQWRTPAAGIRPVRTGRAVSILPGGRVIAPAGEQYVTGPKPVALAISSSGRTAVTVNRDRNRSSLTILEHDKTWTARQVPALVSRYGMDLTQRASDEPWSDLSGGLASSGEHSVFVSEGNTGRVALIDLQIEEQRRVLTLDSNGVTGSIAGDLAFDAARNTLYVADLAHSRVVSLDSRTRQTLGAVELPGTPLLLALAPDQRTLYAVMGRNLAATPEKTGAGVTAVDVTDAREPRVVAVTPTVARAAGIFATADQVFLSNPDDDSVTVIGARTHQVEAQIAIRIPGLEAFRGILPAGMAYDTRTGWLLVAETGLNAVAVLDPRARKVLGHIPVGWRPGQVMVDRGMAYVANTAGQGTGLYIRGNPGTSGSVSIFAVPAAEDLAAQTQFVMEAAGLAARPGSPPPLPAGIRYVVLIIKNSRSFDEVLGDVTHAANGTVMGLPQLARFGPDGYADGRKQRLSLHHLNITPNHHAIAARWAFSDNFYSDAETNEDGVHWLSAGTHLARHGVSFYRFDEPFDPEISDTDRARRVIEDIDNRFVRRGADLPRVVMIHLPNDHMAAARPGDRYPYAESYLADNDLALGRLLEYFSGTKWWKQMAIFVTEASAEDGIDHVDAHRTILLCAGPWARRNWASHTNTSFPGLLRTIFRLLGVPPSNLLDATAADLSDCFTSAPDPAPYRAVEVDPRLYRPGP